MRDRRDAPLDVLILSPYHGGSHAAWAEGLQRHSHHFVRVESMPARFWKWRMHGAAITLARRLERQRQPADVVVATDMLDLAAFLGLAGGCLGRPGTALYMHENQVTYPLPADPGAGPMRRQHGERDRHYGFVNVTSMLAADAVAFNSEYHRTSLLDALPPFLRHFPDHRETDVVDRVRERSEVVPVGIDLGVRPAPERAAAVAHAARGPRSARRVRGGKATASAEPLVPPLVVWNQRWEYDKNPGELFAALLRLAAEGADFRLALCGERFGRGPSEVGRGIDALGDRIVHNGYLERDDYLDLLQRADVVVSTAHHEFFGVAVLEAVANGATPVLPARLSYPELLPTAFHGCCLYRGHQDLLAKLRRVLADRGLRERVRAKLAPRIRERFAWPRVASRYDALFERLARRRCRSAALSAGRRPPAGS